MTIIIALKTTCNVLTGLVKLVYLIAHKKISTFKQRLNSFYNTIYIQYHFPMETQASKKLLTLLGLMSAFHKSV